MSSLPIDSPLEIQDLIYPKSLLLEFDLKNYFRNIHDKDIIYQEMSIIIFYQNFALTPHFNIYRYISINEFDLLTKTLIDRFKKHSIVVYTYDYFEKGHGEYVYLYQYYDIPIEEKHLTINNWDFLNKLAQEFTKLTDKILEEY